MKALLALSILVPVSFLAMFRLTGVLKQPAEVEKITLEPVTLTLTRPTETIDSINKTVQNPWTQEGAFILFGVEVKGYREGSADEPFCGRDGLVLKVFANASFRQGYISSVSISLNLSNDSSIIVLDINPWSLQALNASIVGMSYLGVNETDAYIKANVLDQAFSIRDQTFWIFLDENNESHELGVKAEFLHINGNVGKVIMIPIILKMLSTGG
jgi:hypothetical protein